MAHDKYSSSHLQAFAMADLILGRRVRVYGRDGVSPPRPTPLWSSFAQHDRFSSFTITIVFAAYAVAVALSLFLAGHLSDWYGRRRMLACGLALNVIAARVLCGLAGAARRYSWHASSVVLASGSSPRPPRHGWPNSTPRVGLRLAARRAQIVAAAANLGGLGLGGLVAGVLAQWAGHAHHASLPGSRRLDVLALLAIGFAPETHPLTLAPARLPPAAGVGPAGLAGPVLRRRGRRDDHVRALRADHVAGAELPRRNAAPAVPCAGRRRLVCDVRRRCGSADTDRRAPAATAAGPGHTRAARRHRSAYARGVAADAKLRPLPGGRPGRRRRSRD